MAPEPEDRLYRFDPADGSGVFLGLGVAQCAFLGTGLVASVAAVSDGVVLPVAALPALAATAASFARLGGRPAWEWLSVLAAWASLRLGRGRRWLAPLALLPDEAGRPTPLPPCLDGVSIVDLPWRGRQRIGAVRDQACHTLTAVVRVGGPAFVVQPRAEQERLVAGWGEVLNQFAVEGGPVTHVAWSNLAAPSGLEEHRAWLDGIGGGEVNDEARASYDELLADATATATAHDVVVTVTVARDRLGRHGGADPESALARVLASSTEALLRGARSAGLDASDPLSAAELQRALRTRIDLVIGNVPFAKVTPHDARHNRARLALHNYAIVKSLDLTRAGGLVVVLTSRYTADARNPAARRERLDADANCAPPAGDGGPASLGEHPVPVPDCPVSRARTG